MKIVKLATSSMLFAVVMISAQAHAQNSACRIQAKASYNGDMFEIDECVENSGLMPMAFTALCDSQFQDAKNFSKGPSGKTPVRTDSKSCPKGAIGVCKGHHGLPVSTYYYNLPPKELEDKQRGCGILQGTWR